MAVSRRTVLEELVVVVTGDATHYTKMMAKVNASATATANRISTVFNSIATRVGGPITAAMNAVSSRIRGTFSTLANHVTGTITRIRTQAIRLRNDLFSLSRGIAAAFARSAAGRALHNFGIGAAAAFSNRQGIGGRPFTRMSTISGAIGARVGAAGALGMRGVNAAATGAMLTAATLRRAGHNMSLGFMAGLQQRFPRFTTRMAQIGSAAGVGARLAGRAGGAIGGAAMAFGPPIARGALAATGFGIRTVTGAVGGLARGFMSVTQKAVAFGPAMVRSMMGAISTVTAGFQRMFGYLTQTFRRLGYDLQFLGRKLTLYLTLPITAFGAAALTAFARFDDAMAAAVSLMGDMGEGTRKMMEQTAIAISGGTRTGPTDLAMGYFQLASAGFGAADAMTHLATVEKFAVAGAFDITETGMQAANGMMVMSKAANYLVGVQAALGMRTKDTAKNLENMTEIADILTKANIVAQARVEDFAEALTNKGAAAIRLVNKPLTEGVAILAAYAAQNVKGAAAGEKLNIVLRDLQRAAIKNATEWDLMGLSVFDTNGKMRHVADIIEDLDKKFGSMSDEQKQSSLMLLGFQDRSVAAIKQLLGMSDAIRDYEKALKDANGTMEKVADVRLKSFASQMMMLRNHINALFIDIGQRLVPAMMMLNNAIKSGIAWWNQLSKPTQKFLIAVAGIAAAMGPVITFLGVFSSFVGIVSSGLFKFLGVAKVITLLFTTWPAIIGGAILGITYLIVGSEGFVKAWDTAKKALVFFTHNIVGFFNNFTANFRKLKEWLTENWKNLFMDAWNVTKMFFTNMTHNAGVAIKTLARMWNTFLGYLMARFTQTFTIDMQNKILDGLINVLNLIEKFAVKFGQTIRDLFSGKIWQKEGVQNAIADMIKFIGNDMRNGAFIAGAKLNIGKAMAKLMADGMKQMKSPLEGFTSALTALPFFDMFTPDDWEAIAEPIENVRNHVEAVKDEVEEPITVNFQTKGIDALRANTAAAFQALHEFRGGGRNFGDIIAKQGGKIPGVMDAKAKQAAAITGRDAKKKAFEDSMKQRRESFLAKHPRFRKKTKEEAPEDPEAAAIAARNAADMEAVNAVNDAMQGPPKEPASEMATLIEQLQQIAINTGTTNELIEGNPIIQIEPANLGE